MSSFTKLSAKNTFDLLTIGTYFYTATGHDSTLR